MQTNKHLFTVIGAIAFISLPSTVTNASELTISQIDTIGEFQPITVAENVINSSIKQRTKIETLVQDNSLGLGVTGRIGTLGIGIDVTKSFSPQLDARLGINFGTIKVNQEESGIKYDANLNLSSIQLLGDVYPIGGSNFRLTGGLLSNNNKFSLNATPTNGTLKINGTDYPAAAVGSLTGEIKSANSIAPYLGIGFGKPANSGLAFNMDLGVMFSGSPKVTLNASNPDFNNNPTTRAEIDAQISKTENDSKSFNIYPVLSFGVSYGF